MRTHLTVLAKVLTVLSFCLPIMAHAADTNRVQAKLARSKIEFTYFGFDSFYSCDYVQAETLAILKVLGAQNVKVTCLGGLPYDSYNSVTATFDTLHEASGDKATTTGEVSEVKIAQRESCDLHKTIFEYMIKPFQVYAKTVRESCWNSQGNFSAKVQVLK
jgi:hypothetical protein